MRVADRSARSFFVWTGAAAAVAGGVWLLGSGDDGAVQTAQPSTTSALTTAPVQEPLTGASEPNATSPVPSTPATTPTATQPPIVAIPVVRAGSIELGPDDLIARDVEGDVRLHPGALGSEPGDPVLLIDRSDPRVVPVEGEGANIIDQVAGTFRGALVYSDCCEPVSGNLFAISEPGAEPDLWKSPTGLSERAQLWGVGYDPELEPGGTRVLAYNWDFVNLVDLETGEQQFTSPSDMFVDPAGNMTGDPFSAIDATWTSGGNIALLGWSEAQGLIVSEHSPDDLRTELHRVPLELEAEPNTRADFVGAFAGHLTVGVFGAGGLQLLDVDTEGWATREADQRFAVPRDASFVRLSPAGNLMAWIVDEVAYLQRVGGEPTAWRDGVAEVWFSVVEGSSEESPTGVCLGGATDDAAVAELAGLIMSARQSGSMSGLSDCLDELPVEFTDIAPACWSSCDGFVQAIADTPIRITQGGRPPDLGNLLKFFDLDVSYAGPSGTVDTSESWVLEPTETGLRLLDISFSSPVVTRDQAVETLTEYLDAVDAENWLAAARMLDDGAISPDERRDLRRLGISDYSYESVAEGLAAWCVDGCITMAPAVPDLVAGGHTYRMARFGEEIQVNWFEGIRSISGLPIRIPATLSAEEARDIALDALIANGHTDEGGDHDINGSATLATTSPTGALVSATFITGATSPPTDATASTSIDGHDIVVLADTASPSVASWWTSCRDVGIGLLTGSLDEIGAVMKIVVGELAC